MIDHFEQYDKEDRLLNDPSLWHIRFRAFGNDFYYYIADSESKPVLKQDDFDWSHIGNEKERVL